VGLPHTDEDYFNEDKPGGDCLDYTIYPEKNKKPGKYNFELLEQLYGKLNRNNRMLDTEDDIAVDDTPEEVKEIINDFVEALETTSCHEYGPSSNFQFTQTEKNEYGEACEISIPGGYSVQIRKLLATNWDLIR